LTLILATFDRNRRDTFVYPTFSFRYWPLTSVQWRNKPSPTYAPCNKKANSLQGAFDDPHSGDCQPPAAAVVAGAAFLATPSAPVKANTSAVNSHRHEIQRTTNECSQAWRYYPGDCIRDYRHSSGKATEVRVVFATQLPNATTSSTK
jgi:hypothetical protein